jgi:hypothetical protein
VRLTVNVLGGPNGWGIGGVGNQKQSRFQGDRRCNQGADVCEYTPMTLCLVPRSGICDRGLPYLDGTGTRSGMISHCASSFHVMRIGSSQAHAEDKSQDRL